MVKYYILVCEKGPENVHYEVSWIILIFKT